MIAIRHRASAPCRIGAPTLVCTYSRKEIAVTYPSKDADFPRRVALRRSLVLLALSCAALLAGCSGTDTADTSSTNQNEAPPVAMPPPIIASHTYRCVGGDVIYVDFLKDERSINVRRGSSGPSARLTAPAPDSAYAGNDMTLTVSGKDIDVREPGKPSRKCTRA
ncbi:hypothetical protein [Sphingomonas sp. KC8]|jgi:hypothetical protein|uniref:hypothetical protein n=1 Tax=Sphingomonas sp. KC8 TaxID=1030157 RepID=UPI001E29DC81|nr:hypothetical protein [Sphingomonas sp. KC8]